MTTDNLWGDLSDIEIVETPRDILSEQARILNTATKYQVACVVEPFDSSYLNHDFCFQMTLRVPSLNHYQFNVLEIGHTIELYPVTVVSRFLDSEKIAPDTADFKKEIRAILSSQEVKKIVSRLFSQARSAEARQEAESDVPF